MPNGGLLKAGISARYQTGYRLSWRNSDYPMNWQETFHTENVNATYSNPDGKWSLSAYVNNITDYAEKRMYMSGAANMLTIGNPRTFGAVLSVRF